MQSQNPHRLSREQKGQSVALAMRRIPIVEVENDPREEPRFRGTQEEPHEVEHGLNADADCIGHGSDEGHGSRYDPPRDHDPSNPGPRTHTVHDKIARHLEEEVTNEEDT